MVSIKDISAACGVSVATVSKALNNQKDVSDATKARIKEVAKQMGYVPNSASRSLKIKRTYNLGIVYDEESGRGLTHDFFAQVLDSFKHYAENHGYDITFVNNNPHGSDKMTYLEKCRYRNFDGVMIACSEYENKQIQEVIDSEIPSVCIDYSKEGKSSVMSDNAGGMRDLVKYVYSLGHRRRADIHGTDSYVTRTRVRSFVSTCAELNIGLHDTYLMESAYMDTKAAFQATQRLLSLDRPPTCILYPDDIAVIGGLNCIILSGIIIGEEISVAGYDGVPLGKYFDPQITTLEQDKARIGSEAAAQLISLIEDGKDAEEKVIIVPGKVFKGGTAGRVK